MSTGRHRQPGPARTGNASGGSHANAGSFPESHDSPPARVSARPRAGGESRTWGEVEEWARQSARPAHRIRWSALRDPKFVVGLLASVALVGGGIHMAASLTPQTAIVESSPGAGAVGASDGTAGVSGAADESGGQGQPGGSGPTADPANSETPSSTVPAGGDDSPSPGGGDLVVHVVGAVAEPQVVTLPSGSRVSDAVEAAGGTLDDADLAAVNMARVLQDGEQIYVPLEGEDVPASAGAPVDSTSASAPGAGSADATGGLVNINTASAAELEELPGVGPAIAQRIVEHRDANGPFASVDALQDVKGIGPATLDEIRDHATV